MFLCIACSGLHRRLGTHISQVRSVNLDTWTPEQIAKIQDTGNAKAVQLYEACVPESMERPQPGDSFNMERWIRDKYEVKLYMREEDGGLGGVRGRAARSLSSRQPSEQPSRYHQQRSSVNGTSFSPRDSAHGRHGGARSSFPSYGDRYGAGSSTRSERSSYSSGGGRFNSNRILADHGVPRLGRGASPYQRAAVMKNLLDMGFDATTASTAVEASGGDLERAVEWVLANKPNSNAPERGDMQRGTGAKPKPPPSHKEVNLLDFGDDVNDSPPKTTNTPLRTTETESILLQPEKKIDIAKTQKDELDFGDFESADVTSPELSTSINKETAKSSINGTGPTSVLQTTSTSTLTSSLAELYRKGQSTRPDVGITPGTPQSPSAPANMAARPPVASRPMFTSENAQAPSTVLVTGRSTPLTVQTQTKQPLCAPPHFSSPIPQVKANEDADDPFADLMPAAKKSYQKDTKQESHGNGDFNQVSARSNSQDSGVSLNDLFGNIKVDK